MSRFLRLLSGDYINVDAVTHIARWISSFNNDGKPNVEAYDVYIMGVPKYLRVSVDDGEFLLAHLSILNTDKKPR